MLPVGLRLLFEPAGEHNLQVCSEFPAKSFLLRSPSISYTPRSAIVYFVAH
jgi:hypothetical protein